MESVKKFKDGLWSKEINVRDFVSNNITPYEGDASFLQGPTERTKAVWNHCLKALEEERMRLQKVCKSLRRSIEDIKAKYPYSMKAFVQDEEQISEKNVELQETIAHLEELRREYQNRIQKMLEEYYGRYK